ncbi:beta-lactamase/transpeptidase-like protein [Massariosphaeria phaeospora]|uniref:Beta-lactamase/transpeptidase-like protein n=1 Tax=Massariosphaeria phaeospora TaxID=100035 RepID=A0A7C8IFU4_9PLEO|nr:beta-lactamase/transpeptidase-like protein [Massariosphaeria phaeospora]
MMLFPALHLLSLAVLSSAKCYEPSTAFPPPEYDADDAALNGAWETVDTALTAAIAAPEFASTSFSVEITSSQQSIWSKHHTARERNASRPDIPEVNGDALYRIASITKTFTVLALLQQHAAGNLSLDDTVNIYVEELNGAQNGTLPWTDITLRSLASQLSGLPREYIHGDLSVLRDALDLGLPPIAGGGVPKCDEHDDDGNPPCFRKADLINAVKQRMPVFAPNQKSTYSNIAFELLGLVIANVTSQSYESYIHDAIFQPLGMSMSSFALPPDSAGVIPPKPQYWDADIGIQNPTGGIYSSSKDLSVYLRHILTHYNGLTHALNWLHPVSNSGGLHTFYGMPWEIFQTDRILLNSRRTVRFVTKTGGLPGYFSVIMIVPEYDLGITILVAGNGRFLAEIREVVTVQLVRAAERVALRQLHERYSGTYGSPQSDLNSSLTLAVDYRGLVVERFISNSTDVLASPLMEHLPHSSGKWYVQVVPTLLYRDEKKQKGARWRFQGAAERSAGEQPVWDDACLTNIDVAEYAGAPLNEVVFWSGEGDTADTLELTGFRVKLVRNEKRQIQLPAERQEYMEL